LSIRHSNSRFNTAFINVQLGNGNKQPTKCAVGTVFINRSLHPIKHCTSPLRTPVDLDLR
jgi:hypothetical protein